MSGIDLNAKRAVTERTGEPKQTAELDRLLDEALADTFPASDPISELRISSPASRSQSRYSGRRNRW